SRNRRVFSKTFSKRRLQSRMQATQPASGYFRQIAGVDQWVPAKTGEHQTHQFGAGRVDGRTGWEQGGGGQIINPAVFRIGLKQLLGPVAHGWFHLQEYAAGMARWKMESRA